MVHEPGGLLRNANGAVNLIRTDPVFAVYQLPHRSKPLVETEGRILEDGSDFDAKLPLCVILSASPPALIRKKNNVTAAARRASDAVLPALLHEIF
jgi:hypothetical protein